MRNLAGLPLLAPKRPQAPYATRDNKPPDITVVYTQIRKKNQPNAVAFCNPWRLERLMMGVVEQTSFMSLVTCSTILFPSLRHH